MSRCQGNGFDWRLVGGETLAAESERDLLVEHIRSCAECRRRAVAIDPSLLFVALPSPEVDDNDVRAMQERVAGARRMMTDGKRRGGPELFSGRGTWRDLGRRASRPAAALAAGIAVLAVLTNFGLKLPVERPARPVSVAGSPAGAVPELSLSDRVDSLVREHLAKQPLVEGTQDVRLQVEGEDFDVVLLVDSELDLGGP